MARSYHKAQLGTNRLKLMVSARVSCFGQLGLFVKNNIAALCVCSFISLITACSSSATLNSDTVEINSITASAASTDPINSVEGVNTAQTFTQASNPFVDQSGVADSANDLSRLLLTNFAFQNQQIVPTTGWICSDSVGQRRIYYYYEQGVLDANRNVVIERTLNPNNTHSDLSFFWSVVAADAILLTSAQRDNGGMLISTGRQYDVSSLRFEEIETVQTFTAESVLRGSLVCGNYDLS